MNKKLLILCLNILCTGCGSNNTSRQTNDASIEPEEISSQFTVSDLTGPGYFHEYRDAQNRWLPFNDSVTNNVAMVRLEPYLDPDQKQYNDLKFVLPHNQFEAIIYQGTLYLKFFQRSQLLEQGVRVKVVDDKFSILPYEYISGDDPYFVIRSGESIQPYSEVEDYVDSTFVARRQVLRLNRKSYEVGDSISGDIAYEGRKSYESTPTMQATILAKGSFKGTVKEGKPFTLTKPKS